MSLLDSLTPEIIALFVAILVPFGIAVAWLSATRTKLRSLEDDVKQLKQDITKFNSLDLERLKRDVKNLTAKVDADLLARNLLQWYREREGEKEEDKNV